ncbi:MAG: NfeD family protein [Planctomycetota bacterium]|nr:NfeD family protein [Planctomycetota bacterium]
MSVLALVSLLAAVCAPVFFLSAQQAEKKPAPGPVFIIPVDDVVDDGMAYFVTDAVLKAQRAKASLIILKINTPGGDIASMFRICNAVGEVKYTAEDKTTKTIPTAAYITHQAMSAGAIIAFSCDYIYMREASTIGSAEPISPFGEAVSEKFVSALAAEMRMRAETKGHPANLAAAMVDKDIEIIEADIDGERMFLTPSELESFKKQGKRVVEKQTVIERGKLLALSANAARQYGVARSIVTGVDDILTAHSLEDATITEMDETWSVGLVRFITMWHVKFVLIALGLVALGIEMATPGFGVPGTVGLLCFALVFFGHYLAGFAEIAEIVLFVVGILLLLIEIFFIPGFGVVGIVGILLMAAGLLLSFQDFFLPGSRYPWQMDTLRSNFLVVLGSLAIALISLVALARFVPNLPLFRRLVLTTAQRAEDGVVAGNSQLTVLTNKLGVVVSPLHPSGKVEIDGQKYDVVTEGVFLDVGMQIEVVSVEGARVVVRRKDKPQES